MRRRLPAVLLVVGIALTVLGLLVTVGPLAFDLGGTDGPPSDGSTSDRSDAGIGDGDDAGDAGGDGTIGDGGTDGNGDSGSQQTIGGTIPEDDPEVTDGGANLGQCLVG